MPRKRATDVNRAKLGIQARNEAIEEMKRRYSGKVGDWDADFAKVLVEKRIALGLPRSTQAESPEEIEAKMKTAEERFKKYQQQLEEARAVRA